MKLRDHVMNEHPKRVALVSGGAKGIGAGDRGAPLAATAGGWLSRIERRLARAPTRGR